MTFLHAGLAAAAVGAVAIPILIHLLMRRRRRPVMWGAMRFLLEAYRRQRRRLMVERWLPGDALPACSWRLASPGRSAAAWQAREQFAID